MLELKLKYLDKKNCSFIGTILKHHGFKGQLIVKSDFDFAEVNEEPVFIEFDKFLVPFFIEATQVKYLSENSAIIKIRDINSENEAQNLLNKSIYFPTELIIENEDETNEHSKLIGYTFFDTELGKIGVIEDFIEIPNNPLFQINYQSKEVLIPINSLESIQINKENKIVTSTLPNGILVI